MGDGFGKQFRLGLGFRGGETQFYSIVGLARLETFSHLFGLTYDSYLLILAGLYRNTPSGDLHNPQVSFSSRQSSSFASGGCDTTSIRHSHPPSGI